MRGSSRCSCEGNRLCPKWMAELDMTAETAAIEEKWIQTGKMLSWYMGPVRVSYHGPRLQGVGEDQGLTLWFYTFPDLERFKEWASGAPEHIALHTKMVNAMKAAVRDSLAAAELLVPCDGDPTADIPAIRAELREMYQRIEKMDWANMPPGSIQVMMLGDHD
jgi:hypothetical protein